MKKLPCDIVNDFFSNIDYDLSHYTEVITFDRVETFVFRAILILFAISFLQVALFYATNKLTSRKEVKEEKGKYNPIRSNYLMLKEHEEVTPVNKMTYWEFKKYQKQLKKQGIL